MVDPSRYVLLCDCGRIIAWIDDCRPEADHVYVESNSGFVMARRNHPTTAGAWHTYSLSCQECRRPVNVSESTVDELIDKLLPIRKTWEVRPIPSLNQPDRRSDAERTADFLRMHKIIDDQLYGRETEGFRSEPYAGPFEVYENRYVIPFKALDAIIKGMRARERPGS